MYNIKKEKGNTMEEKVKKTDRKWIYTFHVDKEQEVPEETISEDEKGDEITITKNVTKKVPVTFKFKRPTRKIIDDADLHYSVQLSEGIKAGLLTRNLIARRYDDDGGLFNEKDKEEYLSLFNDLNTKENEYQKLVVQSTTKRSKDDVKLELETQKVLDEIATSRRRLMAYEQAQQAVFDNTAENRARNSTIMWWVLNISYMVNEKGETVPVFPGETYEEKLNYYDELEELYEDFTAEYIKKLAFLVSFWYTGRIENEDDFKTAENMYNSELAQEQGGVDPDQDEVVKLHTEKVKRETQIIKEEQKIEELKEDIKVHKYQTEKNKKQSRKGSNKKGGENVEKEKDNPPKEDN